jgi:hypothetical protein
MKKRYVLLLTATVQPLSGLPLLARTDPALRLADYQRALGTYLDMLEAGTFDQIVFAENSNYDLYSLKQLVDARGLSERVDFVSFTGLDFEPSKGRGYGEFKMVDHAMAHSKMLIELHDAVVWKCTGRYVVRNLKEIMRTAGDFDLLCHCKNFPIRWCELFLMAWNARGYAGLVRGMYPKLANDIHPPGHSTEEALFRRLVDEPPLGLRVVPRFKRHPMVEGIRAWNNDRFDNPWISPKTWVRGVCARWVPSIWV